MIQGQISAWVAKVSEFSSYCGQFVRGVSGLDKRVRSNHHLVIKSFILSDYFFNSFEIQWLWSQGVDLDVWWYVRPCDHRLLVISKHRWKRTHAPPWITFNLSDQGRWIPRESCLKLLFGKNSCKQCQTGSIFVMYTSLYWNQSQCWQNIWTTSLKRSRTGSHLSFARVWAN